jgi:hypothetical protein
MAGTVAIVMLTAERAADLIHPLIHRAGSPADAG